MDEIIKLRQELFAMRQQLALALDAFDQRLAALQPETKSFQNPPDGDWDKRLKDDLKKKRR
jgi:hypothetical protein